MNGALPHLPPTVITKILCGLSLRETLAFATSCKLAKNLVYEATEPWKTLFKNIPADIAKKNKIPKMSEKEETSIKNWRNVYKSFYDRDVADWEFSQMFGEEDSESEESGSESGEGLYFLFILLLFFFPSSPFSFFFFAAFESAIVTNSDNISLLHYI